VGDHRTRDTRGTLPLVVSAPAVTAEAVASAAPMLLGALRRRGWLVRPRGSRLGCGDRSGGSCLIVCPTFVSRGETVNAVPRTRCGRRPGAAHRQANELAAATWSVCGSCQASAGGETPPCMGVTATLTSLPRSWSVPLSHQFGSSRGRRTCGVESAVASGRCGVWSQSPFPSSACLWLCRITPSGCLSRSVNLLHAYHTSQLHTPTSPFPR